MTADQQTASGTRQAEIQRNTSETQITLRIGLDGTGHAEIDTPVPFLNHMLTSLARHGRLDLVVKATGDTLIDDHHTVEDIGIVLGQAMAQAVGTKAGIARFGHAYVPMDEALARAVIDISGRPFLNYEAPGISPTLGGERIFHTDLAEEFWRAVVTNAGITLHLDLIRACNAHHAIEAMFKAFALAWHTATRITNVPGVVPSTKGSL
ncbi:MAG: imidazoleglycerol-phosphate dehydratase HisB [Chloroflexia bacterium]